jgi:hypothetical protein
MNAPVPPAFPPNPNVGDIYLNWVWNGSAWVCRAAGPVSLIKAITTSQTYWPSPGTTFALVDAWGAGGGGGGAQLAQTAAAVGGGGGGSGGHARAMINAALLVNGVICTIGAAGAAGIGATGSAKDGGMGGDTTFGALVVAHGGGGGGTGYISTPKFLLGGGGAGGAKGVGDFSTTGNNGSIGGYTYQANIFIFGGMGAAAPGLGGVAAQTYGLIGGGNAYISGHDALGPGAGGGGGITDANGSNPNGGAGGPGLILVMEFAFGPNTVVQDCGCPPGSTASMGGVAVTEVPPGFQTAFGNVPLIGQPAARNWRARVPV